MAKKKYDPLWEIVDERVPLQGAEPEVDAVCPWCRVIVCLGGEATPGETYECGLCGGVSQVVEEQEALALRRVE